MKNISKKMISILSLGIVIIGLAFSFLIYYNQRLYLPKLPVEGISKQQAYAKISNSNGTIEFLSHRDHYNWYIYQGNTKDGMDELIQRFNTIGLQFKEQIGAGYFFTDDNKTDVIIVESQMWTSKYIIYKVTDEVKF